MGIKADLQLALRTSLFDLETESLEKYRPDFLYNDYKTGNKVLGSLINELNSCDEFIFSIAFITNSGLIMILNTLEELKAKGIKGKVLTSNYLGFNEASALRRLKSFSNIEIKVSETKNIHNKGYIFKKGNNYSLIIGSSNLTQNALTSNDEWNLKVFSLEKGKLIIDVLDEFNKNWNQAISITDDWIDKYEKANQENARNFLLNSIKEKPEVIIPNQMQKDALASLDSIREEKEDKALVISATGTGKTYLVAFDVKAFNPKKMLFVVHREQIAKDAMASFKQVLGSDKTMSVLSGDNKDLSSDYIFSTIQTLSKDDVLGKFISNHFDYICIDEAHHTGANSYIKILNHFKPNFLLGMTATPERTDNINIYQLFDYNIAYEIRLQQALEEDMLTPFHYFGITDITVEGKELDEEANFSYLVSEERVNNIIEKIKFYGFSGSRPKGLVFCSRVDECIELSRIFNKKGYQTTYLSGSSSIEERIYAIDCLEQNEHDEEALDYIFTVDVFNEGIDIIKVNQIIMLRPTQSAIIFVQQLGRGLRKTNEKEYVVVLDFIANYKNNFLIPIALSGDRSYNKDRMRKILSNGGTIIPGASTINFDRIAKENIYKSIASAKFANLKFLREEYFSLKKKLNKIPSLTDLYNYGSVDPEIIFAHSKSYYNFLLRVEDVIGNLNNNHKKVLEYLSKELANGKRPHELLILKAVLESSIININAFKNFAQDDLVSALRVLDSRFQVKAQRITSLIEYDEEKLQISNFFLDLLKNKEFRNYVVDLINYGLLKYENEYSQTEEDSNFVLYKKYGRKDVMRILNWESNETSTVYGYRIKHNTCPIFVTYHKREDISATTKYKDEFIDHSHFSWMSRSNRTIASPEIQEIINARLTNLKIYLFVNKKDDEGREFYYLGKVEPIKWVETKMLDDDENEVPVVNFILKLAKPVQEDVYNYIIEKGLEDEKGT